MRPGFAFAIEATDPSGGRAGRLTTPHGEVSTPTFMPVGTLASVKGVDVETRRIAQRQLLGTMAISAAISGVSGMPFVMMVATATRAVLSALFGDDEEDNKFITTASKNDSY